MQFHLKRSMLGLAAVAACAFPAAAAADVNSTTLSKPTEAAFMPALPIVPTPAQLFQVEGIAPGASNADTTDVVCFNSEYGNSVRVEDLAIEAGSGTFATAAVSDLLNALNQATGQI